MCIISVQGYSNVKICTRARVAKKSAADSDCAPGLLATLLAYNSQCSRLHTIHAPRRVALLVADGDGEASVVGSDQVDLLPAPPFPSLCLMLQASAPGCILSAGEGY